MTRALVTGGKGFIGQHLMRALHADHRVDQVLTTVSEHTSVSSPNEVYCNLFRTDHIKKVMDSFRPDVIFHLAGLSTVKMDETDPAKHIDYNVVCTQNLVHLSPWNCKFVLASSATVYGSFQAPRFDCCLQLFGFTENCYIAPSSVYAASKVGAEAIVQAYGKMGRVRPLILRYVANVGRGATHGVLKDLVAKLKSDSKHLELFGDYPGSVKPYMHVQDTVSATIELALREDVPNVVNISPFGHISIDKLADLTMEAIDIRKEKKWLGQGANWVGDDKIVMVDPRLLISLGWSSTYKMSENAVFAAAKELSQ